jgi:hypothetical protein
MPRGADQTPLFRACRDFVSPFASLRTVQEYAILARDFLRRRRIPPTERCVPNRSYCRFPVVYIRDQPSSIAHWQVTIDLGFTLD